MEKKRGSPQNVPPNNRIIVHNLPFETDEVALKEYFSKYGSVTLAEIPIVRGKPSGFGFVTFSSIEEATKANNPENQHKIEGRALRTNFAMKTNKREASSEEETKGKKLYVGKLPKETSELELRQYFEKFGKVEDAFLATVKYAPELNGFPQHKGYGFVSFENEEDANKVVSIKEHKFKGIEIFVKKALPQQEEKKGRRNRDREGKRSRSREGGRRGGNKEGGHKEGGHSHSPKEGGHDHKHGHKEGGHDHKHGKKEGGHSHSPKEGGHDHKHGHKEGGHSHSPKEGEKGSSSPPTTKNQSQPSKTVPKKSGLHYSVANKTVQVDPKSLVNPWKKIESTQGATANDDYPTLGKGKAKKATSSPPEEKGKQEVEKN